MKPQSAKGKGRAFQKKMVSCLLGLFPELEPDDVTSRSMGAPGTDILLSPKARKLIPYDIECKHRAAIAVYDWIEQRETGGEYPPLVFAKANHKNPIVIMYLGEFMELLKKNK